MDRLCFAEKINKLNSFEGCIILIRSLQTVRKYFKLSRLT